LESSKLEMLRDVLNAMLKTADSTLLKNAGNSHSKGLIN
jgi:hypothetical protein